MLRDSDFGRTTTSSGLSGRERWLLWLSGGVALALALVAFVLWGTRGAAYLLDLVVALCL
jgi:Flp pilus assembly protein TadB